MNKPDIGIGRSQSLIGYSAESAGKPPPQVHHDHAVHFCESEEFLARSVAAYVESALSGGDAAIALLQQKAASIEAEIAERKRAEDELLRSQEKLAHLAAIVESSDDGIVGKSLEGIVKSWNKGAERILGYTAEEMVGRSIMTIIPEDRLDEEAEILSRIRSGQRIDHYETVRRRKDGTLLDVSLTVSPIRNAAGEVIGGSKILRDISDRKRQEEALRLATEEIAKSRDELELRVEERTAALREAVAQMEEFSYTVSHDLRAPIRAMSFYCHALMEESQTQIADDQQGAHYVRRIADNCSRLDRMIHDVLTFSRVARNEITQETVSLDRLVADLIENYPGWQPPNAIVKVQPLHDIQGHEPSICQIVSNLLDNAVKFVAKGVVPEVAVWTEAVGDRVRLWVEDNGIGIDPRYRSRLFGMFERLHPNLEYEGTGVGLAIVRKAALRMGAEVGVESDGRSGSRFWVLFRRPKG